MVNLGLKGLMLYDAVICSNRQNLPGAANTAPESCKNNPAKSCSLGSKEVLPVTRQSLTPVRDSHCLKQRIIYMSHDLNQVIL